MTPEIEGDHSKPQSEEVKQTPKGIKIIDYSKNNTRKQKFDKKVTFQDKQRPLIGSDHSLDDSINQRQGSDFDQESSEESIDRTGFVKGATGECFKSFTPNAILTEEDRKTIEKVREAGYKIPKYNVLQEYQVLRNHFMDDEAEQFEENKKISKYAEIFARESSLSRTQAAALFQARYRFKLNREKKRMKKLMESSVIGFFARKYYCNFKTSKIDPSDDKTFYVKYMIKKSLVNDSVIVYSKDFIFNKESYFVIDKKDLPELDSVIVDCLKAWYIIKTNTLGCK